MFSVVKSEYNQNTCIEPGLNFLFILHVCIKNEVYCSAVPACCFA